MTALTAAIESLKNLVGDRVITPSSPAYEATKNQPWSQTCWLSASCYILLESRDEVVQALRILRETECPFSIRSTGHNPNPGFSSIAEKGVVLDLGGFQEKTLSTDRQTASVGAGCRWGDVYSWLENDGLSVIGGRDPAVGMGLVLGGGYGAVPNLYGTPADNVDNFEIILADGRIVNANLTENPDLYQALKGGGSNFGIVTRFDLKTYPLLKLQYSIRLYNPAEYMQINTATLAMQAEMEKDPNIALFTNYNPGFAAIGLAYANYTHKEVDNLHETYFGHIRGLINVASPTTNGTVLSLANIMAHNVGDQKKRYVGTLATRCAQSIYADVHGAWRDALRIVPEGAVLHYTIQPVGTACVEHGHSRGGNILGLEKVPQCWWVFTIEWPGTGDGSVDRNAQEAVDKLIKRVEDAARLRGVLLSYLAANFASHGQDVVKGYGKKNMQKMQDVASKFDPEGLFQRQDGFLLTE
ncbi:hypothetical protein BDV18DRAFT_161344 [Aspergillus unguis]